MRPSPVILDVRVVKGAGGGPDKTIINSPPYLAARGYRMLCAYMHAPDDPGFPRLREKAAAKGTELISVPDHGPADWRVLRHLLDVCKRENVSVWHGHEYKSNLVGLILRRVWPMRLVTTVHGWVEKTRRMPLYDFVDRTCLRYYEKVICVSDDLYQSCRKYGVPRRRCLLLENGIDVEDYQRRRTNEEAKRELGIPSEQLVIGAVGRLSGEKGFDLLIRVVHDLIKQGHDVRLQIFGEGGEHATLQGLIEQLGMQDRISLMGYRTDLRPCYEAMDLYVLSSLREGLPNVVLEAMAMEVPVVATRVAGTPRVITDGVDGRLVEPGSQAALAQAVEEAVRDPSLREQFRREGRRTVVTHFSFADRMEKLSRLYDEMLASPAPLAGALA